MSNTVTVSFKLPPDQFTVLQALAAGEDKALSRFIRDTLVRSLDLEGQTRLLAEFFAAEAVGRAAEGAR